MKLCRCNICNRVSSSEIETNLGDFTKQSFVPDPAQPLQFICLECQEEIYDAVWELQSGDDFNDVPL